MSAVLKAEDEDAAALKGWLADLEALQQGLARNYANFEYTLQERRIDLPSMAERYRGRLTAATTDAERRRVLEQLLEDFRDGHVNVRWDEVGEEGPRPAACRADMADRATRVGVNWSRLAELEPLESPHARTFSAGLLRRQGRPPLGVVRIGLFSELRSAGARGLVVDVSNNGGGTDWAEVVARSLAGNDLRSARVALLKHPVWEGYLDRWLSELEPQLPAATGKDRQRLERAIEVARAARRAVAQRCDLSAAWSDSALAMGKKSLPCSTLVKTDLFTGGFEPVLTPAARGGAPSAMDALLVPTLGYYGPPPVLEKRLPLIVVVNRETHSAAEQFAALLRDNGRATIVGEPSAGTGCGTFTGEGTAFTLPHSGGRVHVPDCVRLRADGSNERRGIIPDHLIP